MSPTGGKQLVDPIKFGKDGSAHLDVRQAINNWMATEADAQMNLQKALQGGFPLPQAPVMGQMPMAMVPPGMGDIPGQAVEPGQKYWDQIPMPRAEMPKQAVFTQRTQIPGGDGMKPDEKEFYETYLVELILKRLFPEFKKMMTCGTYFVQPQPHLAPPVTAIPLDLHTPATGVDMLSGYGPYTILTIDMPDRVFGVIDRFGFALTDHTHYASVTLSMQKNSAPLRSYGNMSMQLGTPVQPTKLAAPIVIQGKEDFKLIGKSSVDTTVWARLQGWFYAVSEVSNDGSFKVMHTQ